MIKELLNVAKQSAESQNSLQQEQLANMQKQMMKQHEPRYKLSGFFTARQLQALSNFIIENRKLFNE